jgi:hypothetical protein
MKIFKFFRFNNKIIPFLDNITNNPLFENNSNQQIENNSNQQIENIIKYKISEYHLKNYFN